MTEPNVPPDEPSSTEAGEIRDSIDSAESSSGKIPPDDMKPDDVIERALLAIGKYARSGWHRVKAFRPRRSPYLRSERRLADVIAAIQATGTYKHYKRDFADWADRISGNRAESEHWKQVLQEHPEFFRLDSGRQKASLVVRRQRQKRYSIEAEAVVSKEEASKLGEGEVSRVPLTPSETETLVNVAVALHAAALERQRARRWWLPLIAAFLGALAGGLLPRLVPLVSDAPAKSSTPSHQQSAVDPS